MFLDPGLLVHNDFWLLGYSPREVPVQSALGAEVAAGPESECGVHVFTLSGLLTSFPGTSGLASQAAVCSVAPGVRAPPRLLYALWSWGQSP